LQRLRLLPFAWQTPVITMQMPFAGRADMPRSAFAAMRGRRLAIPASVSPTVKPEFNPEVACFC
jgi:hypothetical protein